MLPALLGACENDVVVRLSQGVECRPGDPCSGLTPSLHFHGPYDTVRVPSSPQLDFPQDFTLEAWVLPKSYGGGHVIVNRWVPGATDVQLTFGIPEPVNQLEFTLNEQVPAHGLAAWAWVRSEFWLTAATPNLPSTDAWHHLASAYGGGSYKLYVDGVRVASSDSIEPVANAATDLFIGASARWERGYEQSRGVLWWPPMHGHIAEVRISSVDRYPTDFVPEPRFEPDAATIALWHLDEANGTAALDSGPNQLHGTITGATWQLAPSRSP
jgi:hypothetical protein